MLTSLTLSQTKLSGGQDSDSQRWLSASVAHIHTQTIIFSVSKDGRGKPREGNISDWSRQTSEPWVMWGWELEEWTSPLRRTDSQLLHVVVCLHSISHWQHSDCLSIAFPIFPSPLSSQLDCSTLFFLAAFTNGLVTMEIAAHENLTYSGWEHKFQTFCCGIHPSSCAFQSYYAH